MISNPGSEFSYWLALENNFLLIFLVISIVWIVWRVFISWQGNENFVAGFRRIISVFCMHCNQQISRKQRYQFVITCPSCHDKMRRNNKRLFFCYTSVLFLGLAFISTEGFKLPFQLLFLAFLGAGLSMKELVKYQYK
ncbi:MAG TPA: hypothetical protein ENJ32_05345 [Crenotrichaceae bacterium]|nr:hypothetical protein [Crenotrichaceae bacterium]